MKIEQDLREHLQILGTRTNNAATRLEALYQQVEALRDRFVDSAEKFRARDPEEMHEFLGDENLEEMVAGVLEALRAVRGKRGVVQVAYMVAKAEGVEDPEDTVPGLDIKLYSVQGGRGLTQHIRGLAEAKLVASMTLGTVTGSRREVLEIRDEWEGARDVCSYLRLADGTVQEISHEDDDEESW